MKESLVGQKFNYWTVLEEGHRHNGKPAYKCLCDCGKERVCDSKSIRYGSSKSCGCTKGRNRVKTPESIIGKMFGRLTIIAEGRMLTGKDGKQRTRQSVTYRCECGTEREVIRKSVINRGTQSCGCLRGDTGTHNITHGHAKRGESTATYRTWLNMVNRATRPSKEPRSAGYLKRGIDERWLKFENFLVDMGEKPEGERISIERTNNNIGYFPGNCIWSTDHVQNRNTSRNKYYTINGETLCLTDWAEMYGMDRSTVDYRIKKGEDIKRALRIT